MSRPVAVITGASRGIGKQLSIDFAKEGFDIVAIARSTAENPTKLPGTVDETVQLAKEAGGADCKAIAVGLDVRDEEAVAALAARVINDFGRVDVVINNAAVAPPGASLQDPIRRWKMAMDINVHGPFYFTYFFAPRMTPGEGRIINISSSAAISPDFGRASYTTTKRALEALTECHGHELKGKVSVNCLRLELSVWSEGYTYTLPDMDFSDFEDPIIMSDACLWMARQPVDYTAKVLTISDLRAMGAVRERTRIGDRWGR